MIVKASNKCSAPWLVPNVNNPREQVETVNTSHVPSSCFLLSPSAALCFLQPSEIFSCLSCSDRQKTMVHLKTILLIKTVWFCTRSESWDGFMQLGGTSLSGHTSGCAHTTAHACGIPWEAFPRVAWTCVRACCAQGNSPCLLLVWRSRTSLHREERDLDNWEWTKTLTCVSLDDFQEVKYYIYSFYPWYSSCKLV